MGRKKVVNIIESSEGLPEGFVTQNMLKNTDKEKCSIPAANLEIIKKNHAMAYETEFFTHPDLTSECYSPEWVCFPEYPFVIGLKFPFPTLITKFFASTKLNYAQIMPQGWRCLQTLVRLSAETELEVGLEEFAFTTEIRGFGLGRYGFRVRAGRMSFLNDNSDPADRGWKNKFFFARRNTLVSEEGANFKWRSQVAKLDVLFAYKDNTEENVKKIYDLDSLVRTFKALPVLFVADPEGEVEPEGAREANPEEALSEPIKMSTATRSKDTVSAADLLAEARAKSFARKDSKPPTPRSVGSSSNVNVSKKKKEAKKRKLVEVEATDTNDDMDMVKIGERFKAAITSFVDKEIMNPIIAHVDALKIKAARCSYEAAESKKEATKNADEVKRLKKEENKYVGEVEKLKKDFERLGKEVEVVRAENEAHIKELEAARGDFKFNATKTLLEARIQLMEEYKNGQASTWNMEEERRILEDHMGEPADAEEVNSMALETLIDDTDKALSTIVVAQVEENNHGKETNTTPAAAGQEV